jgi:hypothetical protein
MLVPFIRKHVTPERLSTGLASIGFSIILGILPNIIATQGLWLTISICIVAAISGVVSQLFVKKRDLDAVIKSPKTIRTEGEAKIYARKGFIGFVPLYTPGRNSPANQLSREEKAEAIENLNFERLYLQDSNLWPTIKAIISHSSKLEHCWLLSTQGRNTSGSLPYARLLAEYLEQCQGIDNCEFHFGGDYTISLDDDALVPEKTYDLIRRVLEEATTRYQIEPKDLIADMTTGVRSMTLGMFLACLGSERDIEFMGTFYDDEGRPTGELTPIIFSFEPDVKVRG